LVTAMTTIMTMMMMMTMTMTTTTTTTTTITLYFCKAHLNIIFSFMLRSTKLHFLRDFQLKFCVDFSVPSYYLFFPFILLIIHFGGWIQFASFRTIATFVIVEM
jgi:hypothetical protein